MIERFQGEHGLRNLVAALKTQKIVIDDDNLANDIAGDCKLMQFKVGEVLTTQGGADTDLFFIICGAVNIVINGREITRRPTGTHVGEMALIDPTAVRAATVIAAEATVVACITEPCFTILANKYPHLWRRLALELAYRLRERNKHVKPPNDVPEIFVGSSAECLEIARQIQSGLERDAIVTLWTGVFEASSTTVEDLLTQVGRSDFAVLVVGAEDTLVSRKAKSPAPRDNVIFELGLFMGELGRTRSFIVRERGSKTKLPSDLLGLMPLEYGPGEDRTLPNRIAPVCNSIRTRVKEIGPK